MKKCDIIIPVYKAPEWVKLCVYSLMVNTDEKEIHKVYLINDSDDPYTIQCLKNLDQKYKKVEFIQNEKNLGFIKTVNKGLKLSEAPYVLLLNTDCLVTKNAVHKLMNHMEKDSRIGLICPISSNAANLTLDLFPGFHFSMMNELLEKKFLGQTFDACTVVGNCLMIRKECKEKVGLLDEIYGMGYGEETDYQFKAMEKGFTAKVAIDTYVFHKSEVSFGTSKEKQQRLEQNRQIFFDRWNEQYTKELAKYQKNDPIQYIKQNITEEDKQIKLDFAFYLDTILQNAGGVHVIVDLTNYLAIHNCKVNILYDVLGEYKEIMLFAPIKTIEFPKNFQCKELISTLWISTFSAYRLAEKLNCKLINFVQGYEFYFENGSQFGKVELSYKLTNGLLTISHYLQKELKDVYQRDAYVILNGIPYDLIHQEKETKEIQKILLVLRGNIMKGDWLSLDILKKLDSLKKKYEITLLYMNNSISFPNFKSLKVEKIKGPVSRLEMYQLFQKADLYIDTSLSEGFGLNALEAMTAGCVPIVSNSLGIHEYLENDKNGIIISEVNQSDSFVKEILRLTKDLKLYQRYQQNGLETAKKFDLDFKIEEYIRYFLDSQKYEEVTKEFTEEEQKLMESIYKELDQNSKSKFFIYKIAKILPKGFKNRIKKIINLLRQCY